MNGPSPGSPTGGLRTIREALQGRLERGRGVDTAAVKAALGIRSEYLAGRLLYALDPLGRGFRTADEFTAAAESMMTASVESKLAFLFRMHDVDASGKIDREEIERMVHIGLAEHALILSEEDALRVADALLNATDRDGDRQISFQEFLQLIGARPKLRQLLARGGVELLRPGDRAEQDARERAPKRRRLGWLRNGVVLSAWVAAYVAVNLVLAGLAAVHYHAAGANGLIVVARACGAALNWNGALVLVPMLRHLWTAVRRRRIGELFPIDDGVNAHRWIGLVIFWLSWIHGLAHALNIAFADPPGASIWRPANVTGVLLLAVLTIMWLFSREAVRRSGHFELFHYTHVAYVAWFALACVHGPSFWMWVALPLLGYGIERIVRLSIAQAPSRLLVAEPKASGVTHLEFECPPDFNYQPGDYVFIRIPVIARHEWHPFTLTSAPEQRDRLGVHIRSLGNWTSAVRERFEVWGREPVDIYVDGPYGTPSSQLLECPHAVAIAAGIGVTPFASILQSLWWRQTHRPAAVRRLHFVWLAKDQHSFEWFRDLLARLEATDSQHRLDVHIYMTGGHAGHEGSAFELAREMFYEVTGGDLVTGLKAKTNFGRPDFGGLLRAFAAEPNLPSPTVFYCGPEGLSRSLARSCRDIGLRFRQERF